MVRCYHQTRGPGEIESWLHWHVTRVHFVLLKEGKYKLVSFAVMCVHWVLQFKSFQLLAQESYML